MHKYIDASILRYFDNGITIDDIIEDLRKHNIHGYAPDVEESEYYIADALYSDMIRHRSNYKAYIEDCLTARMLMELRFNSLLTFDFSLEAFFYEHADLETPQQVIDHRIKWCRKYMNKQYCNFGWQNFFITRILWKGKANDIEIDYEFAYEDRKYERVKTPDEYIEDRIDAVMIPTNPDGSLNFTDYILPPDDEADIIDSTMQVME